MQIYEPNEALLSKVLVLYAAPPNNEQKKCFGGAEESETPIAR
jgi:hypothetical protein